MERMTSPRRWLLIFTALLLSACEPTPSGREQAGLVEDDATPIARPQPQSLPRAREEVDGCEMLMHPCRWEEECTAPCAQGAGHCCDGHWVCPGGSVLARQAAAISPEGIHRTRAPRHSPRVLRRSRPRSVLTFGLHTG